MFVVSMRVFKRIRYDIEKLLKRASCKAESRARKTRPSHKNIFLLGIIRLRPLRSTRLPRQERLQGCHPRPQQQH